jgi:hypothetical protein
MKKSIKIKTEDGLVSFCFLMADMLIRLVFFLKQKRI